jgi:hypothetical protein
MAALGAKATEPTEVLAPDQVLLLYVARLATDGALLFAGHWLLRQSAISSRMAYALMGGVMAAVGYAFAIRNSLPLSPSGSGTMLTIGLLPTIGGMFAGFLYGQFAGLAPAVLSSKTSDEGPATSRVFDGPTRVRTSVAAIAIAAMMPAVLTAILSVTALAFLPGFLTSGPGPVIAAAIPAQLFLTILVATIVPSAIFVLCLHHIVRGLGRHRALEYAGAGSLMAAILVLLLSAFTPFSSIGLLVPAAIYGGIMGGLYRRFAGLEPVPLPEAVIATDANALVGADHPSRQQHRVYLAN